MSSRAAVPALVLAALLVGCGGATSPPAPEAGAAPDDAGTLDAATTDGPSDSGASPDGAPALCCRTGASLFPCEPAAPWNCAIYGDSGVYGECGRTVADGLCGVGFACVDDFGDGIVVVCGP